MSHPKHYQVILQTRSVDIIIEDNISNCAAADSALSHWMLSIYGLSDQAEDYKKQTLTFDSENNLGYNLYVFIQPTSLFPSYDIKMIPRLGIRKVW